MNKLIKIDLCIVTLQENFFKKLRLHGDGIYDSKTNTSIILPSIKFIHSSKRLDEHLII